MKAFRFYIKEIRIDYTINGFFYVGIKVLLRN